VNKPILLCLILVILVSPGVAIASDSNDEIALATRTIFQFRCSGCHGPGLAKPKGRFGYVLDLKRLAANPEMVKPGKPDESGLWEIIRTNEMPPGKPLPQEQKDTVRAWIVAGAPPVPPGHELPAVPPSSPAGGEGATGMPAGGGGGSGSAGLSAEVRRVLADAGKFHLVLLHFPIAFLVAAAIAELIAAGRNLTVPSANVRFCLWSGAVAAIIAAALGWCYAAAGHGAGNANALALHRWLGTGVAAWAVLTALAMERDIRRGKRQSLGQLMVLVGAALVGAAAYFGGLLVHGEIFTEW
jgi:uncharacterized membrane protein